MKTFRILTIDDDKVFVKLLRELLEADRLKLVRTPRQPLQVDDAATWEEARAKLGEGSAYELILFDLKFPDSPRTKDIIYQQGRLKEVRTLQPFATVAIATSYAYEQGLAVCTEVLGEELAEEFIPKDQPWNVIIKRLVRAMSLKARRSLVAGPRSADLIATTQEDLDSMIGQHAARLRARFGGTSEAKWVDSEVEQLRAESARLWSAARPAAGVPDTINWDGFTDELAVRFNAQVGRKLAVDYSDKCRLMTNRGDLTTALEAVVQNAIDSILQKYREEEAAMDIEHPARLEVVRRSKFVEIRLSDFGVGFAPEALDHLFERGRSFWKHQEPRHGGMGLFVARRRMYAIGGDVRVESDPEKGGAVVTLQALDWSPA